MTTEVVRSKGFAVILQTVFKEAPLEISFDNEGNTVYAFDAEDLEILQQQFSETRLPEDASEAERVYDFLIRYAADLGVLL